MNFASCNRLVLEKQQEKNARYHKLKLEEIRKSKRQYKSDNKLLPKRNIIDVERQKQIAKNNALLIDKLTSLIEKPPNIEPQNIKPRKTKYAHKFAREPNVNQRSSYSIEKMDKEWKVHCEHINLACKIKNRTNSKQIITNELSTFAESPNKNLFQHNLKLFAELNLQQPEDDQLFYPQNLAERIILCRKSILAGDTPYLVEISTAYGRVFFVAYNMSSRKSEVLKLRMSEERARSVFSEYDYDFNTILSKVCIEDDRIYVKVPLKQDPHTQRSFEDKPLIQKQNLFIRRNYYDLIFRHKQREDQNSQTEEKQSSNQARKLRSSTRKQQSGSNLTTLSKLIKSSHRGKRLSMAVTVKRFARNGRFNQTQTGINTEDQSYLNKVSSASSQLKVKQQKAVSQGQSCASFFNKRCSKAEGERNQTQYMSGNEKSPIKQQRVECRYQVAEDENERVEQCIENFEEC